MNCKEFRLKVIDLFDTQVNPHTKAECEQHMAKCAQCRDYYIGLTAVTNQLQPRYILKGSIDTDTTRIQEEKTTRNPSSRRWMKVAAMFGGIILIGGISLAAIHFAQKRPTLSPPSETVSVHFANVRLDSVLSVVGKHYGHTVVFRDNEPRQVQLIMTWNPDAALTEFINRLNSFDGLHIDIYHDTIFVTKTNDGTEK